MTVETLLRRVSEALRAAGIPFMVTGSVAAAFHGAGRATMDVDIVIDPDVSQLDEFVAHITAADVYVSLEAARDALQHRTMFNIVDTESGWKADLIIRKARTYSITEFERRESIGYFGMMLDVVRLEDLILSKLEWAKLGASTRQIEDVRDLLRLNRDSVDREYLATWIDALALQSQWRAAITD